MLCPLQSGELDIQLRPSLGSSFWPILDGLEGMPLKCRTLNNQQLTLECRQTYFLFAGFNFVACLHVFFCFPETAQRTLEEIEDVFAQGHVYSAWAIKRDIGKKTVDEAINANKNLVSTYSIVRCGKIRLIIISFQPEEVFDDDKSSK